MISVHYHLRIKNIWSKLLKGKYYCKHFFLCGCIINLSIIQSLTGRVDSVQFTFFSLSKNYSNNIITSITHNFKRKIPIRRLHYRSRTQIFFQSSKCK
uniref:Uncharacterized protein n=1 Tax=Arundo donax TaxID=35708 RepID=A0A0A9BGD5_ARUDO